MSEQLPNCALKQLREVTGWLPHRWAGAGIWGCAHTGHGWHWTARTNGECLGQQTPGAGKYLMAPEMRFRRRSCPRTERGFSLPPAALPGRDTPVPVPMWCQVIPTTPRGKESIKRRQEYIFLKKDRVKSIRH